MRDWVQKSSFADILVFTQSLTDPHARFGGGATSGAGRNSENREIQIQSAYGLQSSSASGLFQHFECSPLALASLRTARPLLSSGSYDADTDADTDTNTVYKRHNNNKTASCVEAEVLLV